MRWRFHDHILTADPPVIQDLAWRMFGLPALVVTLKPPFEVLECRVAERRMDRKLGAKALGEATAQRIRECTSGLRPWFHDEVHANDIADITIDTAAVAPEDVVRLIRERLDAGPGDAFARLRAQYRRAG